MKSRWAISRLRTPRAASWATWRSRGVSASEPLRRSPARPGSGGHQLLVGAGGEHGRLAAMGQVEPDPQPLARLPALSAAAQLASQVDQHPGPVERAR